MAPDLALHGRVHAESVARAHAPFQGPNRDLGVPWLQSRFDYPMADFAEASADLNGGDHRALAKGDRRRADQRPRRAGAEGRNGHACGRSSQGRVASGPRDRGNPSLLPRSPATSRRCECQELSHWEDTDLACSAAAVCSRGVADAGTAPRKWLHPCTALARPWRPYSHAARVSGRDGRQVTTAVVLAFVEVLERLPAREPNACDRGSPLGSISPR